MPAALRLGYRPDIPDPRDRSFAEVRDRFTLPAAKSMRFAIGGEYRIPLHRAPRDQRGNSCTANAWCRALEILSDLDDDEELRPDFSAQGLYWCERERVGETDRDDGAYLRCGADALKKLGCASSAVWPDDESTITKQPPALYFVNCEDGKLAAYYRIDALDPCDDVELAIRSNYPVVYGVQVGQEFVDYDGDPSRVFDPPASPVGGHAMVLVAVRGEGDDRSFLSLNSWGRWGMDGLGLAWISAAYLRSARDIWTATRAP